MLPPRLLLEPALACLAVGAGALRGVGQRQAAEDVVEGLVGMGLGDGSGRRGDAALLVVNGALRDGGVLRVCQLGCEGRRRQAMDKEDRRTLDLVRLGASS